MNTRLRAAVTIAVAVSLQLAFSSVCAACSASTVPTASDGTLEIPQFVNPQSSLLRSPLVLQQSSGDPDMGEGGPQGSLGSGTR